MDDKDTQKPKDLTQPEPENNTTTETPQPEPAAETPDAAQPPVDASTTEAATPAPEAAPTTAAEAAPETATTEAKTPETKPKKHFMPILIVIVILLLAALGVVGALMLKNRDTAQKTPDNSEEKRFIYTIQGNSLQDFDLAFLQLENNSENKVYSPLSIKYALSMLEAGTAGESKAQISRIIGKYTPRKYPNSANISFANGIFINNSFDSQIKESYVNEVARLFNADVILDPFKTTDVPNQWVSERTFGLVNNLFDGDISLSSIILTNALAIDMEWENKIQKTADMAKIAYSVRYPRTNYSKYISVIYDDRDYHSLEFNDSALKAKSLEIGAVANRYDILTDLGEDKIREIVTKEYNDWLAQDDTCNGDAEDVETYLPKYLEELGNGGFGDVSSSTDFSFYTDDDVKVFAKDLKQYDGINLQYIGIMPKETELKTFIEQTDASQISKLITSLKPIELNSFKDGVLTEIYGYIPVFNFDYKLDLKEDLKLLGITDVFQQSKADLSELSSNPDMYVEEAAHKANIDFSNDGIKAAAATAVVGGLGNSGCGFYYDFEIPVEKIDLTFDRPYLFLIRDKDSGEIWFAGSVYAPTEM